MTTAALRSDSRSLLSALLADLQQPKTPFISPDRFARRWGVSQSGLARLAGVHRNTVRQNPGSDQLQERMRAMIKVVTSAAEITGDVDKALYWFQNEPIRDYRGRTPAELVADGEAEAVLAYLEDLKNGATG